MEYVGGKSLKQILHDAPAAAAARCRWRRRSPTRSRCCPRSATCTTAGLVYCDFKPDNVIQTEEQLKLIDMGGVRLRSTTTAPIYGTVGYQAPEIATDGPSPTSDLYTVGRTLAVLTFDFDGYQALPVPAAGRRSRCWPQHESFYRLLRRATDPDPRRRFASAGEMAEQLTGVLREVLAVADGQPRPAFSAAVQPRAAGHRPA